MFSLPFSLFFLAPVFFPEKMPPEAQSQPALAADRRRRRGQAHGRGGLRHSGHVAVTRQTPGKIRSGLKREGVVYI